MHFNQFLALVAILLWLVTGIASAQQLRMSDPLWGFDGKKLPGRFNLFSAILTNEGSLPFDGPIRIATDNIGNSQSQQIYLAPGQQRIVHFIIFIGYYDGFTLTWKGGDARLPDATSGPPATVTIVPDDHLSALDTGIRAFPESRFPTSVAGTTNLHAAVIGHVPRWDTARRTAFMDWVRGGGVVAIGKEAGGEFPKFAAELEDLNPRPDGATHLGSGMVIHFDSRVSGITPAVLRNAGIVEPKNFRSDSGYRIETEIPAHLGKITRPQISWGQIFFIAFLYVLIVGPVHFLWGRRQKRAVVSIGAFLATVAAFSWIFTVIGRRGYGERTRVYSLSIANDVGNGNYDVTQWSSVFVTSGDVYRLFHPDAESSYYARGDSESSSTRFSITSGKDATITAEIPLFSHSSFLQRTRLPGPRLQPKVTAWETDDARLRRLDLEVPSDFPSSAQIWIRHQNLYHALTRNGGKFTLSSAKALRPDEFLSQENLHKVNRYNYDHDYSSDGYTPDSGSRELRENRAFEDARHLLVALMTSGSSNLASSFERPHETESGRADLFVYTQSPPSFRLGAPFRDSESGYTLYRTTIYPPTTSP